MTIHRFRVRNRFVESMKKYYRDMQTNSSTNRNSLDCAGLVELAAGDEDSVFLLLLPHGTSYAVNKFGGFLGGLNKKIGKGTAKAL